MAADIAQTCRTEQSVGNGVQQRIGIGMSEQPFLKRNLHASEYQIPAFCQLMDIITLPDTDIRHNFCS